MQSYSDRSPQYLFSYNEALRLDAQKRKRPEKLKCRPGYEQRGAACQKVSRSIKPVVNPSNIAKLAIGTALVGGAGVVAARHINSSSNKPDQEPIKELIKQPVEQLTKPKTKQILTKRVLPAAAIIGGTAAAYMALDAKYQITNQAVASAYMTVVNNKQLDEAIEKSSLPSEMKRKASNLVGTTKAFLAKTALKGLGLEVIDVNPERNSTTYRGKDGSLVTVGSSGSRVLTFGSTAKGDADGTPIYEMGFKINESFEQDKKVDRKQAAELIQMAKAAYATHLKHLPDNAIIRAEPYRGDGVGEKRKSIYEKEGFRELPLDDKSIWALKKDGKFTPISDEQVKEVTNLIRKGKSKKEGN